MERVVIVSNIVKKQLFKYRIFSEVYFIILLQSA